MDAKMLDLYFIAGSQNIPEGRSLPQVLEEALQAGITCFQLREKGEGSVRSDPAAYRKLAQDCQNICRSYQVPFLINDDVDLALELDADGVHVGQADEKVEQVRERIGAEKIIGLTADHLPHIRQAEELGCVDYVGLGPISKSTSKLDTAEVLGVEGLREITEQGVHLPIVAIGGITPENAAAVRQTGVDGLAFISVVSCSDDIEETVKQLRGG